MKNKKILVISIILVIVVILLLGVGIAVAYLTTDIFKTEQQLFAKYFSQFGDIVEQFDETDLLAYFEKQNNTPYENTGKLSFNVKIPDYEEVLRYTNSLNISFNGKTDPVNNKKEQHFQINYSDTVNFPFDYKHTGDLYALASNIVANKYVAVRNDNLPQTLVKMGIDPTLASQIPNKIEPVKEDSKLSKEQLKNILNNYFEIIKSNLKESNFSKVSKDSFALTLTQEELKIIILDLLQELKNDEVLLNIGNSQVKQELQKQIEELITEFQEVEATTEEAVKITVYQKEGKLSKIQIHLKDIDITLQIVGTKITVHIIQADSEELPVFTIEKVKRENEVNYLISYKLETNEDTTEVNFNARYTGLSTENVEENYILKLSNIATNSETQDLTETKYEYNLNTTKKFSKDINIEDLTQNTALILNDQDITYVRSTMSALGNKIAQLNKSHTEKLGISEAQNPLIMATPLANIFLLLNDVSNVQESVQQTEQEQLNNLQSMLVQATNKEFENYKGNEVKGTDVKALLQLVTNTIAENKTQIVRITYNDQNLTPTADIIKNVRNVINTAATYNVSFGYSNITGLIDTVIIKINAQTNIIEDPTEINVKLDNYVVDFSDPRITFSE